MVIYSLGIFFFIFCTPQAPKENCFFLSLLGLDIRTIMSIPVFKKGRDYSWEVLFPASNKKISVRTSA
jgi:hypothetical protein